VETYLPSSANPLTAAPGTCGSHSAHNKPLRRLRKISLLREAEVLTFNRCAERTDFSPSRSIGSPQRPGTSSGGSLERHLSTCGSCWAWRGLHCKLLPLEAGTAQHRPALRRLEWNRCFGPTLRAGCPRLCADPSITADAFGLALFAALRVVFELLIVKEELLACREDETGATVYTFQYAILEFHGRFPTGRLHRSGRREENTAVPVPCLCELLTSGPGRM
jgi:hypothetical protein